MLRDYSTISKEAFEVLDFKADQEDLEYLLEFIAGSETFKHTKLWIIANDTLKQVHIFRTELENAIDESGIYDD